MATKQPLTEEEKDQKFLEEYEKVCKKHNRRILGSPNWRYSQDGNDFRLVINLVVARTNAKS